MHPGQHMDNDGKQRGEADAVAPHDGLDDRILHRTTRSVSLTDAGQRLLEQLRPAIDQIAGALDDLSNREQRPSGNLRIHTIHMAAAAVITPIWRRFLSKYPDVRMELGVDEARIDIVKRGFDAGIGPRDRAAADMIAVRVMGPMKVAIVGAPDYFAKHSPPRSPKDLASHSCIQYRRAAGGDLFKWAFECKGKSQQISVDGRLTVNDSDLAVRAAVDGLGIAYTLEGLAEPFLRSGQLVQVLENWSPAFEGLFLFYPGHRQVPTALRAFIDMIRAAGGSASGRRSRENPFATA